MPLARLGTCGGEPVVRQDLQSGLDAAHLLSRHHTISTALLQPPARQDAQHLAMGMRACARCVLSHACVLSEQPCKQWTLVMQ